MDPIEELLRAISADFAEGLGHCPHVHTICVLNALLSYLFKKYQIEDLSIKFPSSDGVRFPWVEKGEAIQINRILDKKTNEVFIHAQLLKGVSDGTETATNTDKQ